MTWNYRVVKRELTPADESVGLAAEFAYGVHEVYYEEDTPVSVTEHSVEPFGESFEELWEDMAKMLRAFTLPVLNYSEIPARKACL